MENKRCFKLGFAILATVICTVVCNFTYAAEGMSSDIPLISARVWGSSDSANESSQAYRYFKDKFDKIGSDSELLYGKFSSGEACYDTFINFGADIFYNYNQNISFGIRAGMIGQNYHQSGSSLRSINGSIRYKFNLESQLTPVLLGAEYTNHQQTGFIYGASLYTGVGIHNGQMEQEIEERSTYLPGQYYSRYYKKGYSAIGWIGELDARLGYNFIWNLGIYFEAGYRIAIIKTNVPDPIVAEGNNSFLFGTEHKEPLDFDFGGINLKLGLMYSL